jgi:hypothetical protein
MPFNPPFIPKKRDLPRNIVPTSGTVFDPAGPGGIFEGKEKRNADADADVDWPWDKPSSSRPPPPMVKRSAAVDLPLGNPPPFFPEELKILERRGGSAGLSASCTGPNKCQLSATISVTF